MADPVAVTRKPAPGPTGLSLSRDGDAIKAVWGNPVDGQWDTNSARWDHLDENWTFNASKNMSKTVIQSRSGGRHVTGDRIWVRDAGLHSESTVPYNRSKYHPLTSGRYLNSVSADIFAENAKGKTHIYSTFTFQGPRAPEFGDITLDSNTGDLSCDLETDEGKDAKERYDTMYCVTRQDSPSRGSYKTETVIEGWKSTTEKKITVRTSSISDVASVLPGEWVKVTFKAYSRGIKGNSGTVSKSYVVSQPAVASIKRISVSDLSSSGVVTVFISTNSSTYSQVDTVQLQVQDNSTAATPYAASQGNWTDVSGAVDNATCNGLSDAVGTLPDRGKHRWYRIKSTRGNSAPRYSEPVEAKQLFRDGYIVSDTALLIDSCTPGDDGTSAIVVLGWDNDDTNGTEVSWSDNEDAWYSSNQPTTYEVTWKDSSSQVSEKDNSATFVIRGLEEGKPYYVKARRYMETGNTKDYGPYVTADNTQYPITPVTRPSDVRLNAPDYVERGKDIEMTWTFEGTSRQTAWTLYRLDTHEVPVVESAESAESAESGQDEPSTQQVDTRVVVASGEDAAGSAIVPAEVIPSTESVRFVVSVTTGGEWSESSAVSVGIADAPSLVAVTDAKLMMQPLQLYATCSSPNAELICKVTSRGVSGELPCGEIEQANGDCVWSERLSPAWVINDEDGMYYTTATAPMGLELYDLAKYDLTVQAVDTETGMTSSEKSCEFLVQWAHQAVRCGSDSTVEVDESEFTATITPTPPQNALDTDVFDLYRVTADGPYLIAEGVPFGASVTDRYAPYGHVDSLAYRVSTRTADGDVDWGDIPYELDGRDLRLDWDDGDTVSLPWNVGMQDSYEKDFEERVHLDGSRSGYWNAGRSRKSSLSSEMVRLKDWSQADLLRKAGSYAGPLFVRTSDGCAFQANVDVDGIDSSYQSTVLSASISAAEVRLTEAFMVSPGDISFPEGEEPQPDTSEPTRQQILRWNGTAPQANQTFTLNEMPYGSVSVTLQTSVDAYGESWDVPATNVGDVVTLGTFGADLIAYISRVSQTTNPQFLLKAYYDISPAESGESSESSESSESTESGEGE